MKDFIKAYKLYMKASFSGIVVACATAVFMMMLLTLMMTMTSGISPTDDVYMPKLGTIDMVYVIQIVWLMMGKTTITTSKFFMSVNSSKHLYTTAPIAAVLSVEFIVFAITLLIALFTVEIKVIADFVLIFSVNTVLGCFIVSFARMPKINLLFIIPYILLFAQPIIFNHDYFTDKRGFGFELPQAVAISAIIHIAGIGLDLLIMDLWWKKSGRSFKFVRMNNSLANIK